MKKYSKFLAVLLAVAMILPGLAQVGLAAEEVQVTRLAGGNAVETAIAVSQKAYNEADTVIVAGRVGSADALTGALLAASKDAPLLIAGKGKDDNTAKVVAEIKRLGAKEVIILGGEVAVAPAVKAELAAIAGVTVKRVDGDNRYDTAAKLAEEANNTENVFLALGRAANDGALADALAIGPVSAIKGMPVLLTRADKLPAETVKALKDLKVKNVTIVGGTGAVSAAVKAELEALGLTVDRVGGDNRYETSALIARKYFENPSNLLLANGKVDFDALVGGYFGAKLKAPVLLTRDGKLADEAKAYMTDNKLNTYILGGEGVISKEVAEEVAKVVGGELEEEGELKVVSVSAINAKTLKVTFNREVSEADQAKAKFEVKRGTVKPAVKAPVFSEDKMSATIEANIALAAGDYTVTVTELTEEALTGTVKVEAEKLVKISFLSKEAVKSTNDILTKVVAENQYGEDVTSKLNTSTNSNITVTASKGTAPHSIDKDGNLKVAGTTTTTFLVDDKVVVTVVDSNTGVTATETLTVVQAANVASIVLGEVKTDDEELAKKPVNVSNMTANAAKYYVPVTIKDQYGNTLKAAELAGVTIVSSNNSIVKPNGFGDTKNGTIIKLQTPDATITNGTAVLTVISASTGKTANVSIVVKEDAKLDMVTLEAPSTVLKDGVAAVLPTSITNTYGETVELKDVTVGGNTTANMTLDTNTKISAIGATLKVEQDYVNKKAVLKVTPSQKNVTITVVTATGKSQVLNLVAEEAPVVTAIKGLDKDFVSVLANDVTLDTDLKAAVKFVDQYGEDIAAPTFDATDATSALDYTIEAKDDTNAVTTYSNGVITASTTAGTEVYKVILKDATNKVLDTLEVTVSVVDADKLTAFGIDDLNKFYTGAVSSAHDQVVVVHGLYNGKKVVVNQNMLKDVSATNGLVIAANGVYTANVVNTDDKDVAAKLNVLVANAKETYTITKDVLYNSAAPKAQSLVSEYDKVAVKGGVAQVPFADLNGSIVPGESSPSKLQVIAKDQYGVQRVVGSYNVVVTNKTTTGTFSASGVGSGFIAGDAGKSLQLNVRVDGILETVKVIVE